MAKRVESHQDQSNIHCTIIIVIMPLFIINIIMMRMVFIMVAMRYYYVARCIYHALVLLPVYLHAEFHLNSLLNIVSYCSTWSPNLEVGPTVVAFYFEVWLHHGTVVVS